MLIILEGPDGGGKSTLADKFRETQRGRPRRVGTGWEYRSQLGGRTMTGEEMRTNTYKLLNDLRNGRLQDQTCLVERLHVISDEVYRGLFGGKPFLSALEAAEVYKELGRRTDVRVVYCRPPVQKTIDLGLKKAGDDTVEWLEEVSQKLRSLYSAYDLKMNALAWDYGISVVRYDFSDRETADGIERVICAV